MANTDIVVPTMIRGGWPAAGVTALFSDDFNRGDSATVGDDWDSEVDTGSLLSILSNTMKLAHTATTAAYVQKDFVSGYATLWGEFSIQFDSTSFGGAFSAITFYSTRINDDGASGAWLNLDTGAGGSVSGLHAYWKNAAGSTVDQYNAYTFSIDTPYTIKVQNVRHATAGIFRVWVNGALTIDRTGLDTAYHSDYQHIRLGSIGSSITSTTVIFNFDSFSVGETDPG